MGYLYRADIHNNRKRFDCGSRTHGTKRKHLSFASSFLGGAEFGSDNIRERDEPGAVRWARPPVSERYPGNPHPGNYFHVICVVSHRSFSQRFFHSSLGDAEFTNDDDDNKERDEPGAGWRAGPPASECFPGNPGF